MKRKNLHRKRENRRILEKSTLCHVAKDQLCFCWVYLAAYHCLHCLCLSFYSLLSCSFWQEKSHAPETEISTDSRKICTVCHVGKDQLCFCRVYLAAYRRRHPLCLSLLSFIWLILCGKLSKGLVWSATSAVKTHSAAPHEKLHASMSSIFYKWLLHDTI